MDLSQELTHRGSSLLVTAGIAVTLLSGCIFFDDTGPPDAGPEPDGGPAQDASVPQPEPLAEWVSSEPLPEWIEWAVQAGGEETDTAYAVAANADGGFVVVGRFAGNVPEVTNAFVSSFDAAGAEGWTVELEGLRGRYTGAGASADDGGNIVVVGVTRDPAPDAFISVFDASGNERWSTEFGTDDRDEAQAVAVDSEGNYVVVGATNFVLHSLGAGVDAAVVRAFRADGTSAWSDEITSDGDDRAMDVDVGSGGDIAVAGIVDGVEGESPANVFVRVYDSLGVERWTRQFGSDGSETAASVTVDESGNVAVAGSTHGDLVQPVRGSDAFVRVYDAAGNELWTRQFGSDGFDRIRSITTDAGGNFVLLGTTSGGLAGPAPEGLRRDSFIRVYDPEGTELWTRQFGMVGYAVDIDTSGRIVVAGNTEGSFAAPHAGRHDAVVLRTVADPSP